TTQVPQFILDNYLENNNGSRCNILVTQPRRISAIGVAQRVAAERGEPLGTTVGYQIRLESVMSEKTRILFCTTGILLRRLEGRGSEANGSWGDGIDDVSHIIVDEVHERSLESDFLLMVLKDLLKIRYCFSEINN
ncbi:ATPdependent RNA helicase, partial [Nowakowskiella sp. JEL0078]